MKLKADFHFYTVKFEKKHLSASSNYIYQYMSKCLLLLTS